MAFTKKTWVDRLVEFAGRRKITNVSTMQAQIVDVERAEGTVSQEGSAFSAQTMNDLEQRIADGFSSVENSVDQISSEINNLMIIKKIVVLENGNFPGNNSSHIAFTVDIPDGYSIISISSYSSIWTIQTTIATTLDGGYEVAIHNISTNAYDASIYVIVGLLKTM